MPRIVGVRQQRCQFLYDTDFITAGTQSSATQADDVAQANKTLFAGGPGRSSTAVRTNMPSGGFLSGDQTFLCYAVRHELNFYGGNSDATPSGGVNPACVRTTAAVVIATIALSTFSLVIGDSAQFQGPMAMTPAGGGPWGFVSDSQQPLVINGEPQNKAIYVLPYAIAIPKRQRIAMEETKSNVTGAININILDVINGYTGFRMNRAYIDGLQTRDVQ